MLYTSFNIEPLITFPFSSTSPNILPLPKVSLPFSIFASNVILSLILVATACAISVPPSFKPTPTTSKSFSLKPFCISFTAFSACLPPPFNTLALFKNLLVRYASAISIAPVPAAFTPSLNKLLSGSLLNSCINLSPPNPIPIANAV